MPNPQGKVLSHIDWPPVPYEGNPQDMEVSRAGNLHVLGQLRVEGGIYGGGGGIIPGHAWYVDDENGDDLNDGTCWASAFKTIQRGINQARYGAATGALEYVLKGYHNYVFVRPGHYNQVDSDGNPKYISMTGYGTHLVGVEGGVPGRDYGVSINFDHAVDTTAVLAFGGSHNSIHNIHFGCAEAIPMVYMTGGDNNLIEGCVFEGDNANCTEGILAPNMKGSWIRNNVIVNCAIGIDVIGGANCYFIYGGIVGNQIHSRVASAKGIYIAIAGLLVSHGARISHNYISLDDAGAIGIDIDHTGTILVSENNVCITGAGTGIETAGVGVLHNHVSVNSLMVGEAGATAKFVNDTTQG